MILIYYLPALMIFLSIFLCNKKLVVNNVIVGNASALLWFISIILIFILTGFKGDVDPDYKNYLFYFEVIPPIGELTPDRMTYIDSITSNAEVGMIYVMSLMKSASLPFQSYYVFTAFIISLLSFNLARLYKGFESYILIFLYCFYFQPYFIQTRYFISVLCVLICFVKCSRSGRISPEVLLYFFLGVSFHTVGFFILPLIFSLIFKDNIVKYWYLTLLFPLFFMLVKVDGLLSYAGVVNARYDTYVSNDLFTQGDISSFYIRYCLFIGLTIFCYLNSRFKSHKWDDYLIEFWLLNLFMLSVWSVAWNLGMLYRIALLFEISWLFFIFYSRQYLNGFGKFVVAFVLLAYALFRLIGGVSELEPFVFYDFNIY